MNKQRKVLITITYNEMGIIIDTKAEEVAQPNLQPTCNQPATDCISRQAAVDAFDCTGELIFCGSANAQNVVNYINKVVGKIKALPPAQPEIIRCGQLKYAEVADSEDSQDGYTCQFHQGKHLV